LGGLNFGKTLSTVARLWMVDSFFDSWRVESVGAIEWVTNVAARLLPHSGAVEGGFSPSRRTYFFQYAAVLAGGFHFLPLLMDLPLGVCAIRSNASDVPVPIFLPSGGLRMLSLATSTLATTCLLAEIGARR